MKTKEITILILFTLLFTVGCQQQTTWVEPDDYTITIDGRLPLDKDGFYHLKLLRNKWQTLHRITGIISSQGNERQQPQKVNWESSHYWQFNTGDTIVKIYRRTIDMTGHWVVLDSQTIVSPDTMIVPTINPTSYSNDKTGEINTMIAPVLSMLGDTMTIRYWWSSEWYKTDTIQGSLKIILD